MLKIIQFTHPGAEHGSDKNCKDQKSWNQNSHKRKFILSKGKYNMNDVLNEGD